MSIRIKYAYLHGQVWLYRRNYPEDVALVLGSKALKRSLKTSDAKVARTRVAEVNAVYEEQVERVRTETPRLLPAPQGEPTEGALGIGWGEVTKQSVARLRAALETSGALDFGGFESPQRRSVSWQRSIYASGQVSFDRGATSPFGTRSGCSPASTLSSR